MSEKITYSVQGSTSEPYTVKISLSPFVAECTCQAAEVGLPCRHRIKIISGEDPGIVSGDKNRLPDIAAAAKKTPVFDLLKTYDEAKAGKKAADDKADKAFRKYRDARVDLLMQRVKTDRAVIKARGNMETAIESVISAYTASEAALAALRGIFIRPSFPAAGDLVATALNESD
jgi:hypothetical protein